MAGHGVAMSWVPIIEVSEVSSFPYFGGKDPQWEKSYVSVI